MDRIADRFGDGTVTTAEPDRQAQAVATERTFAGKIPPSQEKLTFAPLLAATFFLVAAGPYRLEELVHEAGYRGAIVLLLLTPLLWSLPMVLGVASRFSGSKPGASRREPPGNCPPPPSRRAVG